MPGATARPEASHGEWLHYARSLEVVEMWNMFLDYKQLFHLSMFAVKSLFDASGVLAIKAMMQTTTLQNCVTSGPICVTSSETFMFASCLANNFFRKCFWNKSTHSFMTLALNVWVWFFITVRSGQKQTLSCPFLVLLQISEFLIGKATFSTWPLTVSVALCILYRVHLHPWKT